MTAQLHEEVIEAEVIEVSASEGLTRAEAELLTAQIRSSLHHAQELIVLAWTRRAWESLGYESWNSYIAGEFQDISLRPPLESRQETVAMMRQAGMSIRAISAATTLSVGTVDGVLRKVREQAGEDTPIKGVNGKVYSPTNPVLQDSLAKKRHQSKSGSRSGAGDLELPEDLLALPAEEFGVTDFVPTVPKHGGGEVSLPGFEEASAPLEVGRDYDLPAVKQLLDQVYEALVHSLEQVGEGRFPAEVQSPELVLSVTNALLVSAGLLEKLGLARGRLPEHSKVVSHLQVVAATLDRVADHLAGDAGE